MALMASRVQTILSIGKQRRNKPPVPCKRLSGFTLIELMLVTVIILALVSLSTPLFKRTFEDIKLETSAREMASVINFLHERAVFERTPYRLEIDTENSSYQALKKGEEENRFEALKERWGRVFKVPSGIEIESETDTIDFLPNGIATSALINLTNRDEKTKTISLKANTGSVSVYDNNKE